MTVDEGVNDTHDCEDCAAWNVDKHCTLGRQNKVQLDERLKAAR